MGGGARRFPREAPGAPSHHSRDHPRQGSRIVTDAPIAYAANATWLPGEFPWEERLRRIAKAGFKAVEILFPQRQDLDELERLLHRYDLRLVLIDVEFDPQYPRG